MTSDYVFDKSLLRVWYGFNGLAIALNTLTMIIAAYNCWRYVYDKGIRKVLILLFYIAVFSVTVSSIIIAILNIFYPERDMLESNEYVNAAKEISIAILYWSIGMSMW